ncbi:MAG: hypothetical protein FWC55_09195 [Firmicutes bacterium]|nr:hypothetical protein [Bacillota bacterium]
MKIKKPLIYCCWIISGLILLFAFTADMGLHGFPKALLINPARSDDLFNTLFSVQATIAVLSVSFISMISLLDKKTYLGMSVTLFFVKSRKQKGKTILELSLIMLMYAAVALELRNTCVVLFAMTIALTMMMFRDIYQVIVFDKKLKGEIADPIIKSLFSGSGDIDIHNENEPIFVSGRLLGEADRIIRTRSREDADDFINFLIELYSHALYNENGRWTDFVINSQTNAVYKFAGFYYFNSKPIYDLHEKVLEYGARHKSHTLAYRYWYRLYMDEKHYFTDVTAKSTCEHFFSFMRILDSGLRRALAVDSFLTTEAMLNDRLLEPSFVVSMLNTYDNIYDRHTENDEFLILCLAIIAASPEVKQEAENTGVIGGLAAAGKNKDLRMTVAVSGFCFDCHMVTDKSYDDLESDIYGLL